MVSDHEFAAARRHYDATRRSKPPVRAARYDAARDRIVLYFETGAELAFSPKSLKGFETAAAADLVEAEVNAGTHVHFMPLDEGFCVPALIETLIGGGWMAAELGRKGGGAHGPLKAAAARANGTLGGRPRKHPA